MQDPLIYEAKDGVAWLTFNRPDALNAFNTPLRAAIAEAIETAENSNEVYALVLCGAGGRAFSSGADLKELARSDAAGDRRRTPTVDVFASVAQCRKAIIAAIDGYCIAAGMEVATLCDIRIATETSQFGLPEVRRSLMPDPGLVELPRIIPLGEVMKLVLTGTPIPARRAYEIGFLQALVPDRDALMAEAARIAGEVALGAPLAAEAYKQVIRNGRSMSPEQAAQYRAALWDLINRTEDRAEGPRAFVEKRPPVWRRR